MTYALACRRRAHPNSLLALRLRLRGGCAVASDAELLVEQEHDVFECAIEARYRGERRQRALWESDGREALAEQLWRLALTGLAGGSAAKRVIRYGLLSSGTTLLLVLALVAALLGLRSCGTHHHRRGGHSHFHGDRDYGEKLAAVPKQRPLAQPVALVGYSVRG